FVWFRSERVPSATPSGLKAPPPCTGVVFEVSDPQASDLGAFEAVTGKELDVRRENGKAIIHVPDFPIMACVVLR
ncbi:MAG: hypothetical protein JJ992_27850, partial [Planctomycetes bacterium]|nr:hypothetical protein [Planctomycetota bacterium]